MRCWSLGYGARGCPRPHLNSVNSLHAQWKDDFGKGGGPTIRYLDGYTRWMAARRGTDPNRATPVTTSPRTYTKLRDSIHWDRRLSGLPAYQSGSIGLFWAASAACTTISASSRDKTAASLLPADRAFQYHGTCGRCFRSSMGPVIINVRS